MDILKFRSDVNSKVYFFSDIHAGHSRDFILNPRGFANANEAKETIIKNWNEKVTNNDIAFLLGDTVVGAGTNGLDFFNEVLRRLNYKTIYIMPGNHFSGFTQKFADVINHTSIDNYFRLTFSIGDKTVHLIPNIFEIYVNGVFIALSHYPIFSYNGITKNGLHFFGHVHGNLNKTEIGRQYLKGRVLEVSPESIGNAPISFEEAFDLLKERKSLDIDHH